MGSTKLMILYDTPRSWMISNDLTTDMMFGAPRTAYRICLMAIAGARRANQALTPDVENPS